MALVAGLKRSAFSSCTLLLHSIGTTYSTGIEIIVQVLYSSSSNKIWHLLDYNLSQRMMLQVKLWQQRPAFPSQTLILSRWVLLMHYPSPCHKHTLMPNHISQLSISYQVEPITVNCCIIHSSSDWFTFPVLMRWYAMDGQTIAQPSPLSRLQAATKLPSAHFLYVHIQGKFTNIQGKS